MAMHPRVVGRFEVEIPLGNTGMLVSSQLVVRPPTFILRTVADHEFSESRGS